GDRRRFVSGDVGQPNLCRPRTASNVLQAWGWLMLVWLAKSVGAQARPNLPRHSVVQPFSEDVWPSDRRNDCVREPSVLAPEPRIDLDLEPLPTPINSVEDFAENLLQQGSGDHAPTVGHA